MKNFLDWAQHTISLSKAHIVDHSIVAVIVHAHMQVEYVCRSISEC